MENKREEQLDLIKFPETEHKSTKSHKVMENKREEQLDLIKFTETEHNSTKSHKVMENKREEQLDLIKVKEFDGKTNSNSTEIAMSMKSITISEKGVKGEQSKENKVKPSSSVDQAKSPNGAQEAEATNLKIFGTFVEWTIADVDNKFPLNNWEYNSEMFRIDGIDLDMDVKLVRRDGSLEIHQSFKCGDDSTKGIHYLTLLYTIRDQVNSEEKQVDIVFERYPLVSDCVGAYTWIHVYRIEDAVLHSPYVKDNRIKITIDFRPCSNYSYYDPFISMRIYG